MTENPGAGTTEDIEIVVADMIDAINGEASGVATVTPSNTPAPDGANVLNVVVDDASAAPSTLADTAVAGAVKAMYAAGASRAESVQRPDAVNILLTPKTTMADVNAFALNCLMAAVPTGEALGNALLEAPGIVEAGDLVNMTCGIRVTGAGGAQSVTYTFNFLAEAPEAERAVMSVYRLYNPYLGGAHLLTADAHEVEVLTGLGWKDEGARFRVFAHANGGALPVYRLYNPANGDHFFTQSNGEAAALALIGWQREGEAWYAPTAADNPTAVSVFRLYNPFETADGGLGNHLWTTLVNERNALEALGWSYEGVAWRAFPQ